MEQRRLRLGDILDDYCPRERRITNHAVVAMVEDDVKQTRCTTCDAEHEFKHGKVPAPRRKRTAGALSADSGEGARPVLAAASSSPEPVDDSDHSDEHDEPLASEQPEADALVPEQEPDVEETPMAAGAADDDGPVHRRLIRATLPRPEGQVPERKEPDFTLRQQSGRGFEQGRNGHRLRGGSHRPMRNAQGQGGQSRFGGGQRQGHGGGHGQQGQGQGNRAGRPGGGQGRGGARPGGPGRKRGR
jgi:hypothetical protein